MSSKTTVVRAPQGAARRRTVRVAGERHLSGVES
jgi:hypothetical protein